MITRRLQPVRPPSTELLAIEKRLKRLWLELVYKPLLKDSDLFKYVQNSYSPEDYERLLAKQRKAEGLTAAVRERDTGKIFLGVSHNDAAKRNGLWNWSNIERGFVNESGKFLTSDQVERMVGTGESQTVKAIGEGSELMHLQKVATERLDAYPGLDMALSSGRLTYHNGTFSGKFNAAATKELKALGAEWDFKDKTFHLTKDKLPAQITRAINTSETRFVQKLNVLDAKLVQILDENVWKRFVLTDLFDKSIFRMDKEFRKNVETVTVQPAITDYEAKKISEDWQKNLERDIKGYNEKLVQDLREKVKESYFSGDRYGSLIHGIQKSFGVTERKAEFLARNETNNLAAAYQGARYVEAGIPGYHWKAVTGTAAHPTRHRHSELSRMSDRGRIFYWDKPPRTTEDGQPARYNNPGQDYNCRCSAIPVYQGKK